MSRNWPLLQKGYHVGAEVVDFEAACVRVVGVRNHGAVAGELDTAPVALLHAHSGWPVCNVAPLTQRRLNSTLTIRVAPPPNLRA